MTDHKKKKGFGKHLDKIVMGAIIGGAVLSVIGARRMAKKREEKEVQQQSHIPFDTENAPKPKKKGILRRLLGL